MSPTRRTLLRRRCLMLAESLALSFRSMGVEERRLAEEVDVRLRRLALLMSESLPKKDGAVAVAEEGVGALSPSGADLGGHQRAARNH